MVLGIFAIKNKGKATPGAFPEHYSPPAGIPEQDTSPAESPTQDAPLDDIPAEELPLTFSAEPPTEGEG